MRSIKKKSRNLTVSQQLRRKNFDQERKEVYITHFVVLMFNKL